VWGQGHKGSGIACVHDALVAASIVAHLEFSGDYSVESKLC
jgi:hypothetical protein